jgi:hypothetical protein
LQIYARPTYVNEEIYSEIMRSQTKNWDLWLLGLYKWMESRYLYKLQRMSPTQIPDSW